MQRAEICGFILILLLAIFLRIYQIDRIPPGIFVDETNASLDALHILEGNHASPFATGWYETPNLYFYYMAVIIKVLGANFVSLKIISLLPAILSVIAVFFLGRLLFGPKAGLSTMLFMQLVRYHDTQSIQVCPLLWVGAGICASVTRCWMAPLLTNSLRILIIYYTTEDVQAAKQFLDQHQVQYIIVGGLERAYYDANGLNKFQDIVNWGVLRMVFGDNSANTTTIFEVVKVKK